MAKTTKLYEVISIDKDLKTATLQILAETEHTFSAKTQHFDGYVKTYHPFVEEDTNQVPTERDEIVTTIDKKLNYTFNKLINHLDVSFKKEQANQRAMADIVIDGKIVASDVPATYLLSLENLFTPIRKILMAIPTLQPGILWEKDKNLGPGIYKSKHNIETLKTSKTFMSKILVEPTKEHPAQIEKWAEAVPIGKYITESMSGRYSSADKAEILKRFDKFCVAVKQARQRANAVDVTDKKIGEKLTNYLLS